MENNNILQDAKIEQLLEAVVRAKASDLHIQVGLVPMLRINGDLIPVSNTNVLTPEAAQELIFSIMDETQRDTLLKDKEFDLSFAFGDLGRFRVNVFQEQGNFAAAFRFIPQNIPSIDELHMPATIENFTELPRGLVLVTGPAGSGKTTTLASLIDKINREKAKHIITIEDPIEFQHKSQRSIVAQREVHYDTFSFNAALRSVLREDPDVILIGEMRDLETISAALTIAETGHLVFATLHTNSAAQSIDRIVNVFPAHQQDQVRTQLAGALQAVVSQRLVPTLNGQQVPATEILLANAAVRNIIREGKTHQLDAIIQTSADQGMQSMDHELSRLVKQGTITLDDAKNYAIDVDELVRMS